MLRLNYNFTTSSNKCENKKQKTLANETNGISRDVKCVVSRTNTHMHIRLKGEYECVFVQET
jgi:hypothetical protein